MQQFTARRTAETEDEIWLLEHPPVYTVGVRGKAHEKGARHFSSMDFFHAIPTVQTDRGGLITYHGPGQLIAYVMIDLARKGLGIRDLVSALENATIDVLRQYGIVSHGRPDAPGVYIDKAKIASVGLRVKKFRSYHGLSLNVDMDLTPFQFIDPCGYANLQMTQLADLGVNIKLHEVAVPLLACLMQRLHYRQVNELRHHLPEYQGTSHGRYA